MIVTSDTGSDDWTAIAGVGGVNILHGPLQYPESSTPSGSFFDLGHDRGYGKFQVRGDDSGIYLAVNTDAKASLSPAAFEAAFVEPNNWTWHDGTTGPMNSPLLTRTVEHDFREMWFVPQSNPDDPWLGVYDADFGRADGGLALGYFSVTPQSYSQPVDPAEDPPETLPATGFPKYKFTNQANGIEKPAHKTRTNLMLEIPKLGLEMDIVGVPQKDGEWDVSWLSNQAGYLYGTAFPTWEGNTVITAHVWDANNNPGPFSDLKMLRFGDQIKIHAYGQTHFYEVREQKILLPGKVDAILQHEEYDWVTLLTCELYNPLSGKYIFRRVVRAVLVNIR